MQITQHFIIFFIRFWPIFANYFTSSVLDQYLVSIRSILGSIWPVLDQYFISISWIFGSIWIVLYQYLISIWSIFDQCLTSDARPVYYQYLTFFLPPCYWICQKRNPDKFWRFKSEHFFERVQMNVCFKVRKLKVSYIFMKNTL